MKTAILIPAYNEALALPTVLAGIPPGHRVVVCDNNSTDDTAAVAREAGAEVVFQPKRGYGSALLAGLDLLRADPPDVVVVWDGDNSVNPADLDALLSPIQNDEADFVLGERLTRGDPAGLTPPQRYGNHLATFLIGRLTGHHYQDMGPFRAIRWSSLTQLRMEDPTWGWNVEMQMKAARAGLRIREIPVDNRVRIGQSKISGTLSGVLRAGAKIMYACWRYRAG